MDRIETRERQDDSDRAVQTLDTPLVEARLKEFGVTVVGPERRSSDYLKRFLDAEIEKWAVTIKASGVSLD